MGNSRSRKSLAIFSLWRKVEIPPSTGARDMTRLVPKFHNIQTGQAYAFDAAPDDSVLIKETQEMRDKLTAQHGAGWEFAIYEVNDKTGQEILSMATRGWPALHGL
jgi:hypothetical protein